MENKAKLKNEVYDPINEIKQKFYECKTQEEWDSLKGQLVVLFTTAQELMDEEFYNKYKAGVVNSIEKIYSFKKKYWEKKPFTPKKSFLLQDDLAEALTAYIKLKTAVLAYEYEGRLNIEQEKKYC